MSILDSLTKFYLSLHGGQIGLMAFGLVLILVGILYLFITLKKLRTWPRAYGEVVRVESRRTRISSDTGERYRTYYYPVYQFEAGGNTYEVKSRLSNETLDRGDSVEVLVNPDNPYESELNVWGTRFLPVFVIIFGVSFMVIPSMANIQGVPVVNMNQVTELTQSLSGTRWNLKSAVWSGELTFSSPLRYYTMWGVGSYSSDGRRRIQLKNSYDSYTFTLYISEDLQSMWGQRSDGVVVRLTRKSG